MYAHHDLFHFTYNKLISAFLGLSISSAFENAPINTCNYIIFKAYKKKKTIKESTYTLYSTYFFFSSLKFAQFQRLSCILKPSFGA